MKILLSLYELNSTYQELITLDLEPEDMILALNSIEGDIKDKANNIGKVVNTLQGEQLVLKNEIKRLQAKIKASESKETNIKQYLSDNLKSMNIDKLDCELFKFSFRKSTSLKIDDNTLVPAIYKESIVTEKIDNATIKKLLKTESVPGCHLEEKQNMQIK